MEGTQLTLFSLVHLHCFTEAVMQLSMACMHAWHAAWHWPSSSGLHRCRMYNAQLAPSLSCVYSQPPASPADTSLLPWLLGASHCMQASAGMQQQQWRRLCWR